MVNKNIFLWLSIILFFGSCTILKKPHNPFEPEMVTIRGGDFLLGDFYDSTNTDAIPVHLVTVNDFKIGKYEVTYSQFDHFSQLTNKALARSAIPERGMRAVAYISWDEANEFCRHFGYRLPTEVEWEYAARSRGKKQLYSGTNSKDSLGFFAITNLLDVRHTMEVGITQPNELGLYDMSGNALEWIGEFYQFYSDPNLFPFNTRDDVRIIRGGSFQEALVTNRTYWRVGTLRDIKSEDIGFRCASD